MSFGFSGGAGLEAALKGIAKRLGSATEVRVGFLEDAKYPDGTNVAMVAAIQNYGAPAKGIPPRPFFSSMVKEKSGKWGDSLAKILKQTDYDADRALELMGDGIKGQLQQSIINTNAPALSPVTLLLRERFGNHPEEIHFADVLQARHDIAAGTVPNVTQTQAKPLVWTGHMLASVDYEVK